MIEIEVTATDVRRAAMDLLARREHSQRELIQKLGKKFSSAISDDVIAEEVSRLNSEGLQDDFRLAEAFTRARTSRGQGPVKIKMELRQKGVADEQIALAFESCEIDWCELASEVASRKFGSLADMDMKARAKLSRFLQQRGFTFDHISALR